MRTSCGSRLLGGLQADIEKTVCTKNDIEMVCLGKHEAKTPRARRTDTVAQISLLPAVWRWVAHTAGDAPVLSFAGSFDYSPSYIFAFVALV